jgi:nucleoside-diphosphate-sugar epimerase
MNSPPSYIIIGATGLIGSAVAAHLARSGHRVIAVNSANYAQHVGASADVLINANGNTYRYKANRDPRWDFSASVVSVENSLFDFSVGLYVYVSTIDVYHDRGDRTANAETSAIDVTKLDAYGFHKFLAERLVQKFARRSIVARCGTAIGPGLKKGPIFDIVSRLPVHVSPASTLSLIHAGEFARAVVALADLADPPAVVNVTGTGFVSVAELAEMARADLTLAAGACENVYRYDINNDLLRRIMDIGTTRDMAQRFLNDNSGQIA